VLGCEERYSDVMELSPRDANDLEEDTFAFVPW
jgi:hypothetical protein